MHEIIVARALHASGWHKKHEGGALIVGGSALMIGGDYLSVRIYKLTTRNGLLMLAS